MNQTEAADWLATEGSGLMPGNPNDGVPAPGERSGDQVGLQNLPAAFDTSAPREVTMFRQLTIAILLAGCGAAPLHWPSPDAGHARAQCGFYLAATFDECGCVDVLKSSPALDPSEVLVDGEPLPEAGWYLDDQRRVCLRWCGLRPRDGQRHTMEALMVPDGCAP